MKTDAEYLAMLWKCYGYSRSIRLRNLLVEQYVWLVQRIAKRLIIRLADSVEFDDLVSAGTFGLVSAVERFNPQRGTTFQTFGSIRIHGSIVDELRNSDWLPRGARQRVKRWIEAAELLTVLHGRQPTDDEVAAVISIPADQQQHRMERRAGLARRYGLVLSAEDEPDDLCRDWLSDRGSGDPAKLLAMQDEVEQMLRKLPKRVSEMVRLRHIESRSHVEISSVAGISPAAVCTAVGNAVKRLRSAA